jgi:antitoxin ParD1/3/4
MMIDSFLAAALSTGCRSPKRAFGKIRQNPYYIAMATRNVSFPADIETFIDGKVASGEFSHASEVVREGMRLLMRQDAERVERLRSEIAIAVAQADNGQGLPPNEAWREIRALGMALLARREAGGRA